MKRKQQGLIAGLAVLGLLAAACSSDGESSVTEAPVATDAPVDTGAPTDSPISAENLAHAVEYTGGTAGAATDSQHNFSAATSGSSSCSDENGAAVSTAR